MHKNKIIRLTNSKKLCLFFVRKAHLCQREKIRSYSDMLCCQNYGSLYKLYWIGKKKVERNFNYIEIVKKLRIYQLYFDTIMDQETQWQIQHCDKNIIDLQDSDITSQSSISDHEIEMDDVDIHHSFA